MSFITILSILATSASIIGNVLVVLKKKSGFVVWTIGNIIWIIVDVKIGLYAQIAMMALYATLNIWGWREWNKEK